MSPIRYTRDILDYRYLAIEGPIGVGKSTLAKRLAARLDATVVLDDGANPFLTDFYAGRPGAAFQAQLFSLLGRHRQQVQLRQVDLFSQLTVGDYLFDKDKIYAYLNLDDNELFIYQHLYDLLVRDITAPDLVVYLQTPTDVLRRRLRERRRQDPERRQPDVAYLGELNEAYNHFFFHYSSTPLLVVETSHCDLGWGDEALSDLLRLTQAASRHAARHAPLRALDGPLNSPPRHDGAEHRGPPAP